MRTTVLLGLLLAMSLARANGWSVSKQQDEMRGTPTIFASTSSVDQAARLVTIGASDGRYGAAVEVEGLRLACGSPCFFSAKFNDGEIQEYLSQLSERGDAIVPFDKKRFVRSVELSSVIYVEVETELAGKKQYKFVLEPSPVKVSSDPVPRFMRHGLGSAAEDIGIRVTHRGSTECKEGIDPANLFRGIATRAVTACFVDGYLESVRFTVGKSDRMMLRSIDQALEEAMGSQVDRGAGKRWPDSAAKGVSQFHTSGSSWVLDKEVMYIYGDDSLRDLKPPMK